MGIELEQDDPIDYDSDEEPGCEDCGDCGLPPPRLRPIFERVGRSLDEILELEVQLIQEHTEVDTTTWINCYAERFREILTDDPSLTKYQVKHILYYGKYINL